MYLHPGIYRVVKTVPFGITAFDLKLNFYSHQFTIFMKDITYT